MLAESIEFRKKKNKEQEEKEEEEEARKGRQCKDADYLSVLEPDLEQSFSHSKEEGKDAFPGNTEPRVERNKEREREREVTFSSFPLLLVYMCVFVISFNIYRERKKEKKTHHTTGNSIASTHVHMLVDNVNCLFFHSLNP